MESIRWIRIRKTTERAHCKKSEAVSYEAASLQLYAIYNQPYLIAPLELNVIKNSRDLGSTENFLKANKPFGVTDGQINTLVSHY